MPTTTKLPNYNLLYITWDRLRDLGNKISQRKVFGKVANLLDVDNRKMKATRLDENESSIIDSSPRFTRY